MSTRAVYTFKDKRQQNEITAKQFSVYKHHDGYPSGALIAIENAIPYAWKLPRFEACEFAAAFITGNKIAYGSPDRPYQGGGVYCTKKWTDHGDLEYRYEIEFKNNELFITAYKVSSLNCIMIFEGTLKEFKKFVKKGAY